jgi:hypothetical protein
MAGRAAATAIRPVGLNIAEIVQALEHVLGFVGCSGPAEGAPTDLLTRHRGGSRVAQPACDAPHASLVV